MSLVIRNVQRAVPLRRAPLRGRLQVLRRILGVQAFDLGLVCVDNGQMRRVNRVYRGKDVPTDVLSFPFHEVRRVLAASRQLAKANLRDHGTRGSFPW